MYFSAEALCVWKASKRTSVYEPFSRQNTIKRSSVCSFARPPLQRTGAFLNALFSPFRNYFRRRDIYGQVYNLKKATEKYSLLVSLYPWNSCKKLSICKGSPLDLQEVFYFFIFLEDPFILVIPVFLLWVSYRLGSFLSTSLDGRISKAFFFLLFSSFFPQNIFYP